MQHDLGYIDLQNHNESRSVGISASSDDNYSITLRNNNQDRLLDFNESRIVGNTIANFLNQVESPQSHDGGGMNQSRAPLVLETVRQMIERSNR